MAAIFRKYRVNYHLYADDCQLYVALKTPDPLQPLTDCLSEIRSWLSANFLHLNSSKLEAIFFAPCSPTAAEPSLPPSLSAFVKPTIKNLGVTLDAFLKMDVQINQVVRSCFFHLRRLAKLKSILNKKDLQSVVHVFVMSRLDYANALLYGVPSSSVVRLQLVQNAAARFLMGTERRQHITPVLANLHWLPVRFRIKFKILLLVYKSMHEMAPSYLAQLLSPYVPARTLRSSEQHLLLVPPARYKARGERAFSVCAPKLWNQLPLTVRLAPSLPTFKVRLKTYFYSQAFSTESV